MQSQTKQKEIFLTQAQFDARKTAGTLEQGVVYHITGSIVVDELKTIQGYNASATQVLKNVNGTIQWVTE